MLTNSHVVSNATAVYLRRPGLAKKFKAEILAEAKVRRFDWHIYDKRGFKLYGFTIQNLFLRAGLRPRLADGARR